MNAKPTEAAVAEQVAEMEEQNGSQDDTAIIAQCEKWYTESDEWITDQVERWRRNEKLYDGEIEPERTTTKLKYNLCLAIIETEMAIISDFLPDYDVVGEEEDDGPFADMMQHRTRKLNRKNGLRKGVLNTTRDSLKLSNGILMAMPKLKKVVDEAGAEQDVFDGFNFKAVNMYSWRPSPHATGMDLLAGEARYHLFVTVMHLDEIERIYGQRPPGEGDLDKHKVFKVTEPGAEESGEYAQVKECYHIDKDNQIHQTIYANGMLFENEIWPFSHIGYFDMGNYKPHNALFGIGETYLMRTQVLAVNQVMSAIADNINKTGNPIRLRKSSLKLDKKIQGIPGEEVEINADGDLSYLLPPGVNAESFAWMEMNLRLTDIVTGIHDIIVGKKPAGQLAAETIARLQEAAQARVRWKISEEIEPFMERVGEFIVEVLQKMDMETMSIRQQLEDGTVAFQQYDPNSRFGPDGQPVEGEGPGKSLTDAKLEIEIVAGAQQPAGRTETEARAMQLFKEGVFGIEDVLKNMAEADKEKIIERFYVRQGMQDLAAQAEEIKKLEPEFKRYVKMLADNPEEAVGGAEEENLLHIIMEYPQFLNYPEFRVLPDDVKLRLLAMFAELKNDNQELLEEEDPNAIEA